MCLVCAGAKKRTKGGNHEKVIYIFVDARCRGDRGADGGSKGDCRLVDHSGFAGIRSAGSTLEQEPSYSHGDNHPDQVDRSVSISRDNSNHLFRERPDEDQRDPTRTPCRRTSLVNGKAAERQPFFV